MLVQIGSIFFSFLAVDCTQFHLNDIKLFIHLITQAVWEIQSEFPSNEKKKKKRLDHCIVQ